MIDDIWTAFGLSGIFIAALGLFLAYYAERIIDFISSKLGSKKASKAA